MLVELSRRLGLADRLPVEVNSLGDEATACRRRSRAEVVRYLGANGARLCEECREGAERNPLRVLDCKRPECRPVLDGAPALGAFLCADCTTHFARTREYLDALGVRHLVSPRRAGGLDYYVRTTFELTTTELGAQNAVAGGGRYDGLIKLLGGPPDPGIGFAVGVERVVQLRADAGRPGAPGAAAPAVLPGPARRGGARAGAAGRDRAPGARRRRRGRPRRPQARPRAGARRQARREPGGDRGRRRARAGRGAREGDAIGGAAAGEARRAGRGAAGARRAGVTEGLGSWKRTHTCGALRAADAGTTVTLMGWAHRRRDHGGLIFLELRDRTGLTQCVFNPAASAAAPGRAEAVRGEVVLGV